MKNIYLSLLLLLALNVTYGQTGISNQDLSMAKQLYIKMIESDTYKKQDQLSREFASKLPPDISMETLTNDSAFVSFITARLSDTKFKSVDEALDYKKRILELQGQLDKENADVYTLMQKATLEQVKIIRKPTRDAIRARLR